MRALIFYPNVTLGAIFLHLPNGAFANLLLLHLDLVASRADKPLERALRERERVTCSRRKLKKTIHYRLTLTFDLQSKPSQGQGPLRSYGQQGHDLGSISSSRAAERVHT